MVVRLLDGGVGVGAQDARFDQLVLEQDQILGQMATVPQPNPRLDDVRISREPSRHTPTGLLVPESMLINHEVALDLRDLRPAEAHNATRPLDGAQLGDDIVDIAIVDPKTLDRVLRPSLGVGSVALGADAWLARPVRGVRVTALVRNRSGPGTGG